MFNIFIINLNAGKKDGKLIGNIINEYLLTKSVFNYEIFYTETKEQTDIILNKYKNIYENINVYSIGGDGTLNSVINSIANTNMKLSVIPLGTGNDFYKSIETFDKDKIDLGKVNDKYFINVASIGIDAEIANTANNIKTNYFKSTLVYPISIVKNFFTFKPSKFKIERNNKEMTLLAICNGGFYGGGFNIAPDALLNDGLFNVYEVEKINKLETLKLISKLIKGKHTFDKNVKYYKTNNIIIDSNVILNCNVDGEIIKDYKFDFSLIKDGIKLNNDDLNIKTFLKSKRIIK